MTPVYQTKFTGENGVKRGNCVAACVASLLDLPLLAVPCFEEDCDDYDRIRSSFFSKYGLVYRGSRDGWPPNDDRYYIGSVKVVGHDVGGHCVIVKNEEVVHDPRGDKAVPLRLETMRYYLIEKV